ncbi:hypothetical protein M422DRAFT_239156 [Sphaerobolus stellatus SS14]|nr:hypothetical protein M422DRAFT_239156 [Sphaerobolus stellatus SS14]
MVNLKFLALLSTLLLAETTFAIPSPQSTTIRCNNTGNNVPCPTGFFCCEGPIGPFGGT